MIQVPVFAAFSWPTAFPIALPAVRVISWLHLGLHFWAAPGIGDVPTQQNDPGNPIQVSGLRDTITGRARPDIQCFTYVVWHARDMFFCSEYFR